MKCMQNLLLFVCMVLIVSVAWAEGSGSKSKITEPGKKTALWNGKNFKGWVAYNGAPKKGQPGEAGIVKFSAANCPWSVKDGVIDCKGTPTGYIRTAKTYKNYKLHVEWRWSGVAGNSGVILHASLPDAKWPKSIEAQLMRGNAGDFFVIGGTEFKEHKAQGTESRKTPKQGESSEKPEGEWNAYDIVCKDDTITAHVNGVLKNKATETSVTSGYICLQSEGKPIQFRNVHLEPID